VNTKDFPLSCFRAGAQSVLGGVLAFYLGLVGGSMIVFAAQWGSLRMEWPFYLVAWLFLLPYTVAKLWGLALLPVLAVMLYGLVVKEWNRWVGAALVALAFSGTVLVCLRLNPFESREPVLPFILTLGTALIVLLAGSLLCWWRRRCARP